jgi:hypothetical protein
MKRLLCLHNRIGFHLSRSFAIVLAISIAWSQAPSFAHVPQKLVEVNATGTIPKDQFKTWFLFLVCNPDWLSPDKSKDLFSLYQKFQNFGRTIGDDHLAVWFWKDTRIATDPNLAANVDVERSVRFCKALRLKPSEGPHIVIMASYPDESNLPKDFASFQLAR